MSSRRSLVGATRIVKTTTTSNENDEEERTIDNGGNLLTSPLLKMKRSSLGECKRVNATNTPIKSNNNKTPSKNDNSITTNSSTNNNNNNINNNNNNNNQHENIINNDTVTIWKSSRRSSCGSVDSILSDHRRISICDDDINKNNKRPWIVDDFVLGKGLGKGKFGNVYLAKQKASGVQCALKVLFKAQMQAADIVNMLRREVEIHCRLKHKNIVRLHGYFHDIKNVYLILEYLSQGELFKKVAKSGGVVTETVCKQYMYDIASAVSYMHQRYVAHRDIKPENVLIGEDGHLRLADFGWSIHCPPPVQLRYTVCGTPEYLAPEMIIGKGHTYAVDLWALGIFMHELLYGRTPFLEKKRPLSGNNEDIGAAEMEARQRTYDRIRSYNNNLVFPNNPTISSTAREMISAFLQTEPTMRMEAQTLLESDWIR